jgi:hypothetical protein
VAQLSFASCASCGYRPVYGAGALQRMHVRLVRTLVPDVTASDEVASGLREELARAGALEPGDGWPRVEIEVLRAGDESQGIAVAPGAPTPPSPPGAPPLPAGAGLRVPAARGVDVGVVARAWIVPAPGAPPERDTGDMRASDVVAVDRSGPAVGGAAVGGATGGALDPRAAGFHEADARRAAARRLGCKLGRKLLGEPAASEEED